jgi:hypothetical protein
VEVFNLRKLNELEVRQEYQIKISNRGKKKKIEEYNEAVRHLFINFKKAYDSVTREVLCNILIGFSITMKLVRLIKMYLNEPIAESR